MCCRARVATVASHAIVFVRRPRDMRVIAAIYIGGKLNSERKLNVNANDCE